MRALGVLLLAAACSPNGLTIEVVVDDPNIVKVELFAGRDCGECPTVTAPPGLPLMRVDAGYIVDDPDPFTAVTDDFSNGLAGFRIESAKDTTLAIVVAVGYNAAGEIKWSWSKHGVDIPNGDSAHWQIYLEPTSAISTTIGTQPAGTERIAVWPNPSGHPACLLLEHWGTDPQVKREMLSPVDDFDCDNVTAANECAPFIPNAIGATPTIDTASCVTPQMISSDSSVCTLGGPQCTENPALPRDHCVALDETYCAPSALCQCAGQVDQATCLRNQVVTGTSGGTMPFLKCVIAISESGERCDSNELRVDAGTLLSGSS
ncbi:MAG TPA: hypothetical protein VIV40_09010, partial [Kofleriaceae bacterium]